MANLLPPELVAQRKRERMLRLVALVFAVLAGSFALGAFSLLPAYITLSLESHSLTYEIEAFEKSIEVRRKDSEAGGLERARFLIAILNEVSEKSVRTSEAIRVIIERRTQGVEIRHITTEYDDDERSMRVRIFGSSSLPSALPDFVASLRAESSFSSVDVPLSVLANTRGGTFTITVYTTPIP